MTSQDRDLSKLRKFIRSFGIRLYFRPYTRYSDMAQYVSGESITVFVSKRTSKTEKILSLLHEIGHHLDWIIYKRMDKETERAYTEFDAKEFKKYSKIILEVEKAGIRHMSSIHKILDLEIPLEKVKIQQKIDIFNYQFFCQKRRSPTKKEIVRFEKRLKYGKRKK